MKLRCHPEGAPTVSVVVPARNEESFIGRTLESLRNQTSPIRQIIVVNDGSTDETSRIARLMGCHVIDLPDRGHYAHGPEHVEARNAGLGQVSDGTRYVMILDADHPLPDDYVERLVRRMEGEEVCIASGRIKGEPYHRETPRESGRIYLFDFLKDLGFFPRDYGWESYVLFRALQLGHAVRCYADIVSSTLRPARVSPGKLYCQGKAMRSLGYNRLYALGRIALMFTRSPKGGCMMLMGYVSNVRRHDDIADFVGEWQRRLLSKVISDLARATSIRNDYFGVSPPAPSKSSKPRLII